MWRQAELGRFSGDIAWLQGDAARHSYDYALTFASKVHYGLEPRLVSRLERHKIDSRAVAVAWVRERIARTAGTVRVVLGASDVFLASTTFFVNTWPDLFLPARDDAVVLADRDTWLLFYCHEDELEFGWREQ